MSYQMTGPEDDPTYPWDYLKFGLGAMAPDNAGPFLRDNLGLGLSSPTPAPAPAQDGITGWAASPDQGGLGVRGQSDPAPAGSGMNWVDVLKGVGGALEGFSAGFHGRTPLFVKMQELDQQQQLRRDALAQQQQARQDTIKQQMEQLEEQRRQHDLQLFEKALTSPKASMVLEQLSKSPDFRLSKQAGMLSKAMKDTDYASLKAFQEFIPEEVQQRFVNGELPYEELTSWLDEARTASKENAKQAAKATILKRATDKTPEERTPYETQLVQEHEAKLSLDQSKAELDQVRAANEWLNYGKNNPQPDHSVLNRVHMAQNNGRAFEEGDTASQQRALKEYASMQPQGRTDVQMGTVPTLKDQADYYTVKGLENLELVQAPKGMTEGQYRSGPYRQLDDKEKDAVVQYRVAQKTVETMNKVAENLITAKTPAQALKQKLALEAGAYTGKNGLAAAYQKDRDAFSSRMARLVEVGVLTNTDVTRWSDTFGSFGDTVQTLKAKQALFGEIQDETARLLKLKLGGKPITTQERSKLDQLLDKTDTYRSVDTDFDILMGKGK